MMHGRSAARPPIPPHNNWGRCASATVQTDSQQGAHIWVVGSQRLLSCSQICLVMLQVILANGRLCGCACMAEIVSSAWCQL